MMRDFTTTSNPRYLYQAALHHPFPEWVANEPMPSAVEFEKKAATAFADPARRLLPISSRSAAFHSAINAFACAGDFGEDVLERIKEACHYHQISNDVLPYLQYFAGEMAKEASDESPREGRFAIDTELGGQRLKLLPLDDAADVATSAHDLAKMAGERRIHLLMLVPAAREIVKAADDHGVAGLPELVVHFGSERFPDAGRARQFLKDRHELCKDASLRDAVKAGYAEALADLENDPEAAMEKIAGVDRAAGVGASLRIGHPVPNAFDIVFSGNLVKEADEIAASNVFVRGVLIPLEAAGKVSGIAADYLLSKEAATSLAAARSSGDARDLSLAIQGWGEADQKTFLRMAAEAAA